MRIASHDGDNSQQPILQPSTAEKHAVITYHPVIWARHSLKHHNASLDSIHHPSTQLQIPRRNEADDAHFHGEVPRSYRDPRWAISVFYQPYENERIRQWLGICRQMATSEGQWAAGFCMEWASKHRRKT